MKHETHPKDPALLKAIALAGSAKALSEKLKLHKTAAAGWTRIPLKRVLAIEELFPGQITRYEMRPDYWGTGSNG